MNNQFNLFGDIVQDDSQRFFMSDVTPAMMVGWLAKQEGDITININSLGGSVTSGIAIANAIKAYDKGNVTANVMGVAASIASVIACAADSVTMAKGSFVMIHNPWTVSMGDAEDLRKDAETLDKMKAAIIGFYQSKFSCSAEDLAKHMDAETWIADTECEAYGFAATVTDGEFKAAACATHMAFASAPDAAQRFFSASASQADWQARLAGLQSKKDRDIADLRAKIETLSSDIAEKDAALATAKADGEQLRQKLGEVEKALAETQASLAAETNRYREQVGLALQPSSEKLRTAAEIQADASLSPAEKSKLLSEGKFTK